MIRDVHARQDYGVASRDDVSLCTGPLTLHTPSVVGGLRSLLAGGMQLVLDARALHQHTYSNTIVAEVLSLKADLKRIAEDRALPLHPYMQKLGAAALALFDRRFTDLSMRDYVFLLYEGGDQMRAHNGVIFVYRYGAWIAFSGLTDDATLSRTSDFMIHLEGLFRAMPRGVPRERRILIVFHTMFLSISRFGSCPGHFRDCDFDISQAK